jgi:hypothetical protein
VSRNRAASGRGVAASSTVSCTSACSSPGFPAWCQVFVPRRYAVSAPAPAGVCASASRGEACERGERAGRHQCCSEPRAAYFMTRYERPSSSVPTHKTGRTLVGVVECGDSADLMGKHAGRSAIQRTFARHDFDSNAPAQRRQLFCFLHRHPRMCRSLSSAEDGNHQALPRPAHMCSTGTAVASIGRQGAGTLRCSCAFWGFRQYGIVSMRPALRFSEERHPLQQTPSTNRDVLSKTFLTAKHYLSMGCPCRMALAACRSLCASRFISGKDR